MAPPEGPRLQLGNVVGIQAGVAGVNRGRRAAGSGPGGGAEEDGEAHVPSYTNFVEICTIKRFNLASRPQTLYKKFLADDQIAD